MSSSEASSSSDSSDSDSDYLPSDQEQTRRKRARKDAEGWQCLACTLSNPSSVFVCLACTQPRQPKRKVSGPNERKFATRQTKEYSESQGIKLEELEGTGKGGDVVKKDIQKVVAARNGGTKARHSKVAVALAEANGVDMSTLTGTGKNGSITKADVEAHLGIGKKTRKKRARSEVDESKTNNGSGDETKTQNPQKKAVPASGGDLALSLPPLDPKLQVEPDYSPTSPDIIVEFAKTCSRDFKYTASQVQSVLEMLQSENTVAFITRYRKESTGGMQETDIRNISAAYETFSALVHRKIAVLKLIFAQQQLSASLRTKILTCKELKSVEDLYLPYKSKKESLATGARSLGLTPLATLILSPHFNEKKVKEMAQSFVVSPESDSPLVSFEEVIKRTLYIVAEECAENPEIRDAVRTLFQMAKIITTRKPTTTSTTTTAKTNSKRNYTTDEDESKSTSNNAENNENAALKFQDYFDWSRTVRELRSHQILALNRGEALNILHLKLSPDVALVEKTILSKLAPFPISDYQRELLSRAVHDGYARLIGPSLTRELRRELTAHANREGIAFFCRNLKSLLLTQPLKGMRVLGIDPGFRSGCKLAVIDETGKLLSTGMMNPHCGSRTEALRTLLDTIQRFKAQFIALGSGTASRETEEVVSEALKSAPHVKYGIVNEDGASVYSVSPLAQKEFPQLAASYRGTISIARRLQDPLAELIKIDPESIGVGMYQHDMPKQELTKSVDGVVEDCVSFCGVDVNTASVQLLRRVAGLSLSRATALCAYRDEHGRFQLRKQIMEVKGIGKRSFEQAAGFLMVYDGSEPLDSTLVHPESYSVAKDLLKIASLTSDSLKKDRQRVQQQFSNPKVMEKVKQLGTTHGLQTVNDIVQWLCGRGDDPRTLLPSLRSSVADIASLQEGTVVTAVIKNVVAFGAFCDVGVGVNGLLHNSELGSTRPTTLAVGQSFPARVSKVEPSRKRISLSLVGDGLGP